MPNGDTPSPRVGWSNAYIALGANLGDRRTQLAGALSDLHDHPRIHVTDVSRLYETTPVETPPGHPDYLNAAARIETSLTPVGLLRYAQAVERRWGRVRPTVAERAHAPRSIDVDILLFLTPDARHESSPAEDPILPHPRMHRRAFVLRPLADIAPTLVHPSLNRTVADLLNARPDAADPQPQADADWWLTRPH